MAFLRWLWLNSPNVARTAGGRSLQISSKSIGSTIGSVFHFLITWLLLTKPYRHPLIWSRLLSQPRWDYQKCHFKHFRFERLFRGLRIFGPMYFWLLSSTNSSSREQHCTCYILTRQFWQCCAFASRATLKYALGGCHIFSLTRSRVSSKAARCILKYSKKSFGSLFKSDTRVENSPTAGRFCKMLRW